MYVLGVFICLIALTPFLHLHGMGGDRQPSRRSNGYAVLTVAQQPTRVLAHLSPKLDSSNKENPRVDGSFKGKDGSIVSQSDHFTNSVTTTSIQTTKTVTSRFERNVMKLRQHLHHDRGTKFTPAPETNAVTPSIEPIISHQVQTRPRPRRLVVVFTTLFGADITRKNRLKHLAQVNTLIALVSLKPYVYSLVFTDDEVWAKKARELGVDRVRPILSKNKFKTPFLHGMLKVARTIHAPFHCYINGDILLGQSFVQTLLAIKREVHENRLPRKVFVIGRRYNVNISSDHVLPRDANSPIATEELLNKWIQQSSLGQPDAFDWFVFSKHTFHWQNVPPFVIGRVSYDNCLAHIAVQDPSVATIDGTLTVRAIHQTDSYGNKANQMFKHIDHLWNEERCWRKRWLGWIMFMEYELQWPDVAIVYGKYGHEFQGHTIPCPPFDIQPKLVKRPLKEYENKILQRENDAILKSLQNPSGANVLYTLAQDTYDPFIDRVAKVAQKVFVLSLNENCTSTPPSTGHNVIYSCHPFPPKPSQTVVWDNKEDASPTPASMWWTYSTAYESTLQKWGVVFDAVVLKGRANPQLASFLLLFGYLRRDFSRVFLCCTRPYLHNVHYLSVKSFFEHIDLYWETSMGMTALKPLLDSTASRVHNNRSDASTTFRTWLRANSLNVSFPR